MLLNTSMNQLDTFMQSPLQTIPVDSVTHVCGTIYEIRDSAIVQEILNISLSMKEHVQAEPWDLTQHAYSQTRKVTQMPLNLFDHLLVEWLIQVCPMGCCLPLPLSATRLDTAIILAAVGGRLKVEILAAVCHYSRVRDTGCSEADSSWRDGPRSVTAVEDQGRLTKFLVLKVKCDIEQQLNK